MDGLAQQMAQPTQQMGPQANEQEMMAMMEQIIELLMQGVDPEELVKQGVPPEIIIQAIQLIEQQMAAQSQPDQGLAAQSAGAM